MFSDIFRGFFGLECSWWCLGDFPVFEGVLAGFSPDFSRALTRFFVCVLGDFEGFWGCLSDFRSCLGLSRISL